MWWNRNRDRPKKSEPIQTYTVMTRCPNCGLRGHTRIPRGTPISGFNIICPKCDMGLVLR